MSVQTLSKVVKGLLATYKEFNGNMYKNWQLPFTFDVVRKKVIPWQKGAGNLKIQSNYHKKFRMFTGLNHFSLHSEKPQGF